MLNLDLNKHQISFGLDPSHKYNFYTNSLVDKCSIVFLRISSLFFENHTLVNVKLINNTSRLIVSDPLMTLGTLRKIANNVIVQNLHDLGHERAQFSADLFLKDSIKHWLPGEEQVNIPELVDGCIKRSNIDHYLTLHDTMLNFECSNVSTLFYNWANSDDSNDFEIPYQYNDKMKTLEFENLDKESSHKMIVKNGENDISVINDSNQNGFCGELSTIFKKHLKEYFTSDADSVSTLTIKEEWKSVLSHITYQEKKHDSSLPQEIDQVKLGDQDNYLVMCNPLCFEDQSSFWKTMINKRVPVIVCLDPSYKYWPKKVDERKSLDNLTIENLESTIISRTITKNRLKIFDGDNEFELFHLSFEGWPDLNVPKNRDFDFLNKEIDKCLTDISKPVAVHCRAGIGRSGTFVAGRAIYHQNNINLFQLVLDIRRKRQKRMVETSGQYQFLYQLRKKQLGAINVI